MLRVGKLCVAGTSNLIGSAATARRVAEVSPNWLAGAAYPFLLTLSARCPNLACIGAVPKWLKGADCKSVIRRFESGRRLLL